LAKSPRTCEYITQFRKYSDKSPRTCGYITQFHKYSAKSPRTCEYITQHFDVFFSSSDALLANEYRTRAPIQRQQQFRTSQAQSRLVYLKYWINFYHYP